jgi:signal transduction histidine kinase
VILTLFNLAIFGAGRWAAWSFRQRRLVAVQSAAEAVAKERTRIALDLHDIVADSITSMVLLSAGAHD